MTVNYFIKCPICDSVTRMRTPAGYIYSTPVHIHCGKCKTLLTGEFISDNNRIKAYYKSLNCEEVFNPEKYDFYGEASGEMVCSKIVCNSDDDVTAIPAFSPVFSFMSSLEIEERERFIDYACYCASLHDNWDEEQIKYNLFLNREYDLIEKSYCDCAKQCGYILDSNINVQRYIYFMLFYDCGGLFREKDIKFKLTTINRAFRHLDRVSLSDFIGELNSVSRLKLALNKVFSVFFSYVKISKYLLPAVAFNLYKENSQIDRSKIGISTCTFKDINSFYLDTFEDLVECSDIIVGLDNIANRNSYDLFANKLDMHKFRMQRKGNKIAYLDKRSPFSKVLDLPISTSEFRNAIGHNDYTYDGITQEISYSDKSKNISKRYLLDIAVECVQLMQSACVLAFCIYELYRYENWVGKERAELHPIFYNGVKSQDRCPCGSGKKFKSCCKDLIVNMKKAQIQTYPQKANMRFDPANYNFCD